MRIIAISDLHQKHDKLEVPDGDVFVCAGDISEFNRSREHYIKFNEWIETLPHSHKLVIAGNHDVIFDRIPEEAQMYTTNYTYLQDEEIVIDGIKFYGSPWTPFFYNWAFNLQTGAELERKWAKIPDDTDVLITHGPPYQIYDYNPNGKNIGCKKLLDRVLKVKPKLHLFGHAHFPYGKYINFNDTIFYNVCGDLSQYSAYIIDIEDGEVKISW